LAEVPAPVVTSKSTAEEPEVGSGWNAE